jgi:hypothetical protein
VKLSISLRGRISGISPKCIHHLENHRGRIPPKLSRSKVTNQNGQNWEFGKGKIWTKHQHNHNNCKEFYKDEEFWERKGDLPNLFQKLLYQYKHCEKLFSWNKSLAINWLEMDGFGLFKILV